MTILPPLDMDAMGLILVEFRCDACERTTVQHPRMVVHPVRPYQAFRPQRHQCDGCAERGIRGPRSSTRQLALGSRSA